ncbi:hypothetical protein CWO07_24665 [Vibrio splendidus]|uniref:Uncharacterized protein n=1 Tax=Vibrio splendidus TaxID=29497 RepID=A0A2T5EHN8_VIBSP|nr:hypothetical protein [Vibrio splendidus]PTP19405.1 hypothetical protein CWO07_24665 [Vibrio splendidus]
MNRSSFIARINEAVQALQQITPDCVLFGKRQVMSLRLFSETFDISRTSLLKYPHEKRLVLSAIKGWNEQYGLQRQDSSLDKKNRKELVYQQKYDELAHELQVLRTAQLESWREKCLVEIKLKETKRQLDEFQSIGRFPALVDGFSSRYAQATPLWFQFEVLRIYGQEHDELMETVEKLKLRYGSVLPGGADAFYAILIRPESSLSGIHMLEALQFEPDKVESLLRSRCG